MEIPNVCMPSETLQTETQHKICDDFYLNTPLSFGDVFELQSAFLNSESLQLPLDNQHDSGYEYATLQATECNGDQPDVRHQHELFGSSSDHCIPEHFQHHDTSPSIPVLGHFHTPEASTISHVPHAASDLSNDSGTSDLFNLIDNVSSSFSFDSALSSSTKDPPAPAQVCHPTISNQAQYSTPSVLDTQVALFNSIMGLMSSINSNSEKPDMSYVELVAHAILSVPDNKVLLADIYDWILNSYPYFKTAKKSWKSSVRHHLSVSECFVKGRRAPNGRGFYWSIHPACLDKFKAGDFSRRDTCRRPHQRREPRSSVKSSCSHQSITPLQDIFLTSPTPGQDTSLLDISSDLRLQYPFAASTPQPQTYIKQHQCYYPVVQSTEDNMAFSTPETALNQSWLLNPDTIYNLALLETPLPTAFVQPSMPSI